MLLPNPVGAVDGLCLHGWVPPWVKEDHVTGSGEIEPCTTRLETDQENAGTFVVLERVNQCAAILGLPSKHKGWPFSLGYFIANDFEHFEKLREHENLLAFLHERLQQFHEGRNLRAFFTLGFLFCFFG